MTTIATRIVGPDGHPRAGSQVGLRLVASLNGEAAGLDPTTLGLYQGRRQETVASHGWWLADLKANSLISPTNNYYELATQVPGRGVARENFTAPANPPTATLTAQLVIPVSGPFTIAASTTGFAAASASAPKVVVVAGVVIQYTGLTGSAFTGCTTYATTGIYPVGTTVEQAYWTGQVLVDPPASLGSLVSEQLAVEIARATAAENQKLDTGATTQTKAGILGLLGDVLFGSGRPFVSIRASQNGQPGAVGDFATTDDRAAIQRAIDKAATLAATTGTYAIVYIDAGVYGFSIDASSATPKRAFTAKPNVVVTGPGKLKLRDNQGNYGAIFGADIGVDAAGFELNAVKIDLNATNNAVPTSGDMTVGDNNEGRAIVHITKGNDVKVRWSLFKDVGDLVNAIVVNGHATGADDFVCTENKFLQVGQASFAHDCSVIYWHGQRCDVSRNIIKARSAGLGGCTAAIELHGPGQKCDDNYVENFLIGGYVTGVSENATEVSAWRRNQFTGVAGGVMLLPNTFDTFTSGYALRHVAVDTNIVTVDRDQWFNRTDINGSTGFAQGIFLQDGANLPADDVAVTRNSVTYLASSQPSDAGWSYKDVAFSWMRNDTTIIDRNIQFTDNRSYGALSAGMALSGKFLGLTVDDNLHYDPGSHVNLPGGGSSPWRVGTLFLGTDPTCVNLERNGTVDTRGTHKVVANVYLIPAGTATDCAAIDNLPVNCADAANVPSVQAAGPAFFVRARDKTLAVAPSIPARFGSTWVSETTGAVYRQTSAPSGTAWGKELVPGTPTIVDHSDSAGVLTSVQLRYANALAAGGRVSWSAGGVTETGRLENELVSGTDAPLRLWMYASGLVEGAELRAAADGETCLLVRRNVGGTFTLQRVSMGAADSGGSGFKVLRVPN